MSNYRLTPVAKSDLLKIWKYTAEHWGRKQAKKYLLNIQTKLEHLAIDCHINNFTALYAHRSEIIYVTVYSYTFLENQFK